MALHLGKTAGGKRFELPVDLVTQTVSILAKRGVGKSYTASVMAEELIAAGMHVVILDPLDVWWGLRSSASGKRDGLPVVIFGGSKADLPLVATDGAIVADLVVDHRFPAILSTRHLSKGDQRRFVTDFAERLYERKGEAARRHPLHLVIDEADAFVPQQVYKGYERMVGAIDDLVRRGRASGIGVTLITQRSARINKDVLTQTEVLVALRTTSPQDRKAVEAWIEAHDVEDQHDAFMASLASLPIGTAWVWSPGWLGVFERVAVRKRRTFDSSATPEAGADPITPDKLAPVDLEALKAKLTATIEQGQADDPKRLRRRIAELERELGDLKAREPAIDAGALAEAAQAWKAEVQKCWLRWLSGLVERTMDGIANALEELRAARNCPPSLPACEIKKPRSIIPKSIPDRSQSVARPSVTPATAASRNGHRPASGQRRMLIALAQHGAMDAGKLALLSGVKRSGGTFSTYLSRMRADGQIQGPPGNLRITNVGRESVGQYEPLPVGAALVAWWQERIGGGGERRIFDALVGAYPRWLGRQELADAAELTASAGTFSTYVSRLRTRGLIVQEGGQLRAADELFA